MARSLAPNTDANAPRLGELLVGGGLLPRARLGEALTRQASLNRRLGELLVQMEVIDEVELNAVLALQDELKRGHAEALLGFLEARLGSILLSSAAVTPARLERAVREHERSGMLLGEVLVRQGAITRDQLDGALAFQRQLPVKRTERFRIGRMLVEAGVISQATLDEAIERQKLTGKKLGETLVESGAIAPEILGKFLARQRRLIATALGALSLFGGVGAPAVQAADATRLNIRAEVLRHVSISGVRVPSTLTVTAEDIARGYIDLEEPIGIDLRTNDPRGAILGFSVNSSAVRAVRLRDSDGELSVLPGGASLFVAKPGRGMKTRTLNMRVRLELADEITPGTIAWPLTVYVAPA